MSSDEDIEDIVTPLQRLNLRPAIFNLDNNLPVNQTPIMALPLFPNGFVPQMFNDVPTFNGDPQSLPEFIRSIEVIILQFQAPLVPNQPVPYINKYLVSAARNKLKEKAVEAVTGYNYDTWADLKEMLIQTFGDQRSELNLTIELTKMRQQFKESPIDFYHRIRAHLAIFNAKISLGPEQAAIITYKLKNAKDLALRTLVSGLIEPYGTLVRSRNPDNLEAAINIIRDEVDIKYSQSITRSLGNNNSDIRNPQTNSRPNNTPKSFPYYPNYAPQFQNQFRTQQQGLPQRFPGSSQTNFRPPFNNAPFYKQPMQLQNVPPARFPMQRAFANNVFKPNQNLFKPNNPVTPMEVDSTIRGAVPKRQASNQNFNNVNKRPNFNQSQTNYFKPTAPRNFKSEELFAHENNDYSQYTSEFDQYNLTDNYDFPEEVENDEYPVDNTDYTDDEDSNNKNENFC